MEMRLMLSGRLNATMVLLALALGGCAMNTEVLVTPQNAGFWPAGKTYAVSLTYDDGLRSQVEIALPALKAAGLRGTFFSSGMPGGMDDAGIRALHAAGQELAAHTLVHPCGRGPNSKPGTSLEDYDDKRMAAELDKNIDNLVSYGTLRDQVSFAYPCGQNYVGEDKHSYVPLVQRRFVGARGVWDTLADPMKVDLYNTPGLHGDKGAVGLLKDIHQAAREGAWAVFLFHGVGGDYLITSASDHQTLVNALKSDPHAWVAPFGEVARWIRDHRAL